LAVVVWEEPALKDVERLAEYIAEHNPAAASRIARALREAGDRLDVLPHRGRHGVIPGTRELVVRGRYILTYRVTEDEVRIVRVWHHRQQRRE
jgi:toxin ParE1/3/4